MGQRPPGYTWRPEEQQQAERGRLPFYPGPPEQTKKGGQLAGLYLGYLGPTEQHGKASDGTDTARLPYFGPLPYSCPGVQVVDGTGTKLARRVQRMRDAAAAGWWVKLLVVTVSLRTAAERNANRHRKVPPHVLTRYQAELDLSAATQSVYADEVEESLVFFFDSQFYGSTTASS